MKKILLFLSFISGFIATAQDFLGLQSSNYSGVTGVYSNPANIADSRYIVDVSLIGFNFTADNNYAGIKRSSLAYDGSIFNPKSMVFTNWNTDGKKNFVTQSNGDPKAGFSSLRIVMPSVMVTLDKKSAVAFNWSFRNYVNISGLSQQLADFLYNDFSSAGFLKRKWTEENVNVQQMSWLDFGLTYARVLKLEGKHFIKAGITPRYLLGLEAAYLYVNELQYNFSQKDTVTFFKSNVSYGHSDNLDIEGADVGKFLGSKGYGGFGLDIGGVYEWRPDVEEFKYDMDGKTGLWYRDKNKYKLKVGFSVTDIGGISFKKGGQSGDFVADANNWSLRDVKNASSIDKIDSMLFAKFKPINSSKDFFMMLPTAINLQTDYNIWQPFYVNLAFNFANMFKSRDAKVNEYMTISLAPRFDHKWFGFTLPLTYNTLAASRGQVIAMGSMARIGPLIIGTNDLLNYFTGDVYGANLYALLKVPIPYGHLKDKDKDRVSNKKDLCPDVPGTWEFKGCPDRDHDHVQDKDDKCPDIPGVAKLQGCPDKDGDGITDAEDMCPDSAGTLEFKGCPDRDNDRIIDRNDECPDAAGIAEFKGCPDTDADGTQDKDDLCPEVFGPKQTKGCPDKDADGIIDIKDKCPDQVGPVENAGCPWPDKDKDGVLDKDDDCPEVAGVPELKGCPKPQDPMAQEVPMKAAEKKIIEKAFANLEFASGKDIIKPKSYPALNDLAKLLNQHEGDWLLKLTGHTDNAGTPEGNLVLSEKRAKAVKAYLVKKGVKEPRITAEWFGQEKPIADNATPAGRQKNRRVEMKIVLKE
jgi:outer membrane protein OmpA-like peptidoglycan-associated protein